MIINLKWIKDLNVRAKTMKLLKINIEINLHGNRFSSLTPKA